MAAARHARITKSNWLAEIRGDAGFFWPPGNDALIEVYRLEFSLPSGVSYN